jgi:hypothetical protein
MDPTLELVTKKTGQTARRYLKDSQDSSLTTRLVALCDRYND